MSASRDQDAFSRNNEAETLKNLLNFQILVDEDDFDIKTPEIRNPVRQVPNISIVL